MKAINRVAIILTSILLLATFIFIMGDGQGSTLSMTDTRPRGLAAFGELLRARGIPVELNRSEVITTKPNDLLIYVDDWDESNDYLPGSAQQPITLPSTNENEKTYTPPSTRFRQTLDRHARAGGRTIVLGMPSMPDTITPNLRTATIHNTNQEFKIEFPEESYGAVEVSTSVMDLNVAKDEEPESLVYLEPREKNGVELAIEDASFMTNAMIARADNAKAAIWIVERFLPQNGRVIFAEASAGNAEARTALNEVGNWAVVAFWQLLLTIAVAVFALGRRFGLPSREFTQAKGALELMGAMGSTLRRARRHDHALLILRTNAVDQVRKILRLSTGLSEPEVIARMSPDAQALMSRIQNSQGTQITTRDAQNMARSLQLHLAELEQQQKAIRAPQ
jgi:hypothetical protein